MGSVLLGSVPGRKWVTVGIDSKMVRDIGVKLVLKIRPILGLNK